MTATKPLLLLMEDVRKRLEQAGSVFELRVPSLHVRSGEVVAIVGDSGCGKSTLLDMIALVTRPTSAGKFEMYFTPEGGGTDVRLLWEKSSEARMAKLRRHYLGYILQTGGLLSFLKVRENVGLTSKINGSQGISQRIDTLAKRLGVYQCLDRMPCSLSIGQRQRVAIMRALAHLPQLVLADEPTAAVDKARARLIMNDLRALAMENGTSVIVVTHDTDLVADVDARCCFEIEEISSNSTLSTCLQVA
jgi:putative ABC transport system ATP-binding protein